jgi:succinoglycan biosynthesis protein ExoA
MPKISVIVPCYNEEKTIGLLLDAIYCQEFARAELEVIISDGMSSDRTRVCVADFQSAHPDLQVRIVDNPRRNIPAALNAAIRASRGEIIVRLDAHSVPAADYFKRCMAALEEGKGENVGGIWQIRPGGEGWLARSIAAAAAHPLGVGDALYRYASQPGLVDTVPFGAYRRALIDKIGPYDETLLTNEDYEFNTRIRLSGGKIWLDPAIHSVYFARPDLAALVRQYFRYGYWKYRMLRRYPGTLRWRQALPPAFVLSLAALLILALIWSPGWSLFVLELGLYALILILAGVRLALQRRDFGLAEGVPLAIAAMHFSWGGGFLASVVQFGLHL